MSPLDTLPQLVRALKEAAGPVSGESLAAAAGVSRAAVWKHIQRLKVRGFEIAGAPRQGYRLLAGPSSLLPEEVFSELATRQWQGPIFHYEVLDSTNDLAKDLAARGAPEGALVLAESQRAGRGRLGRSWESPAGVGVYASLILRPSLPPEDLPRFTLAAGVAGVRAVRRGAGVDAGLKWPNDLILNGRKLGGILTEMASESDRISYLVVGWGINVNTRAFPPELADTATSLALARGREFPRLPLLTAWVEEMEALYRIFLDGDFSVILEEWRTLAVMLGKEVTVRQGGREITGKALEVALDGALLLETGPGASVRITSGELAPGP
jgi:BirA family biotin operon repressor/biotin-[acetyl-CoA-carboxylase] ligase